MRILLILTALLLPSSAFALEYRNLSLLYTDAPFIPAESAGISLLTSLGAVQGNPDGTFRSNRTINRAEFLKIVLASYPKVRVSKSDAADCFPDVSRDDWFSAYVCLAKKRGMVGGYPDGEFKPARPVNYAEALKIMGELYAYVAYSDPEEEWYAGYSRAAQFHKTALPSSIKFDRPLTRGQMARLAAAFRANEEGELETYRLAEKSLDLVIAKEIAARVEEERGERKEEKEEVVQEESENTNAAEEKANEASEAKEANAAIFPAQNRFLLLGSRQIIASGFFQPRSEPVHIRNVTVKFREEVKNIRSLYLVDEEGTHIAELNPDTYDKHELTWKAQQSDIITYRIPVNGQTLGIQAVMQDRSDGFAEELIQLKWISMHVSPVGRNEESYQLIATDTSYPAHQTTQASIESIKNVRPDIANLESGYDKLLAEVNIEGTALEGTTLQMNHLTFTIADQRGVTLSNFTLGAFHTINRVPCATQDSIYIHCNNIGKAIGTIKDGGVLFELRGRVEVDTAVPNPQFKIDLRKPGILSTTINPGEMGHVRWTDGTGAYNWVDFEEPLASGSLWK